MDGMGRAFFTVKNVFIILIICIRGEFIQNYFKMFSFLLSWDNL